MAAVPVPVPESVIAPAAVALSSTQIKIAGFFILSGTVSLLVNLILIKNPQTPEKTKKNSNVAFIISSYVVLLSSILALTSSSAQRAGVAARDAAGRAAVAVRQFPAAAVSATGRATQAVSRVGRGIMADAGAAAGAAGTVTTRGRRILNSLQGVYIGSYVLMFINSLILLLFMNKKHPHFLPHQLKTSWILLVVSLCLAFSHKTPIEWKVAIVSISVFAIFMIIKYVKESPKPEPKPKPGDSCTPTTDVPNAQSYVLDKDLKCVVGECDNGFTKTSDNKCIYTQGDAVPLDVQHAVQQSLLDYIDLHPQIFVKKKAIQSAPIYMLANKYDNNDCITKDNKVVESCTSDLINECDNFPNLNSTTKLGIECETVVGPLGVSCVNDSDCKDSAFPDCTYSTNQEVAFCTT